MKACDLPKDLYHVDNLPFRGFLADALSLALARGKPLLSRSSRSGSTLIVDPHAEAPDVVEPLFDTLGALSGKAPGLFAPVTEEYPKPEQIAWSEALRLSVEYRNGSWWLLIDPNIWIWPRRGRKVAAKFLDRRRSDRFNKKYNEILDAWTRILFGEKQNTEITLTSFEGEGDVENPEFRLGNRTAFTRRLS